jgi:lysophospholipase
MGLDSRNSTAQDRGTSGYLQLASYISGLSGGSWAVGSLAMNDWPTIPDLASQTWNLSENLILPADNTISYFTSIVSQVGDKRDEGFPTGITDYWGRALSYHLLNTTYPNHGEGSTFSDIRNTSNFMSAAYPFPLIVADEREAGELLIDRNTTLFEFNPYEFGSWDPRVAAFVPIDILGTNLTNGTSTQTGGNCTFGFDNFGWSVGTSSTLFNGLYNELITSGGDSIIQSALEAVLKAVSSDQNDVSVLPNPFNGWDTGLPQSTISGLDEITLVDGGEDNQNLPINNLLQPARAMDFILAIDSSADTTDWPNGTAIRETFLRYQDSPQFNYIPMPTIPSENTFINRGLNTRPTFFGCNATSDTINTATAANGTKAPIIAYVANYPWAVLSNTSTYQLEYNMSQVQQILDNSVKIATLGGVSNGSVYWPTCLACASLERSFERTNTPRPSVCNDCFDAYCWDGVTNDTTPSATYSPAIGIPEWVTSQGQVQAAPPSTGGNGSDVGSGVSGSSDGSDHSFEALPAFVSLSIALFSSALLLHL